MAYKSATIGDRNVLIHQRLLDQIDSDDLTSLRSAYMVGVAERDLFWKDIRRVLFSGAEYTAFCRIATKGLAESWHPIKAANVLGGIVPNFDELMVELSDMARVALAGADVANENRFHGHLQHGKSILSTYANLLAAHHEQPLTDQTMNSIERSIPSTSDWLSSVDKKRPVFARVTRIVEDALALEKRADGETRLKFRQAALGAAGPAESLPQLTGGVNRHAEAPTADNDVAFLDSEIIAIYW